LGGGDERRQATIFIGRTHEKECGRGWRLSLDAIYRLEGGQEWGREGMRLTMMVNLQCVNFGVEGKLRAETTEERGGDRACISEEEGRGHDSVEGRRVGGAVSAIRSRWRVERWEMPQLGRVSRIVGWMRCTVNYIFHNYFLIEKYDVP
jgi:hypothetical protein